MAAVRSLFPDKLVTWYLEMTHPTQFRPVRGHDLNGVTLVQMETPDVRFYRFLYDSVGDTFGWRDRRLMSDEALSAAISVPGVTIYVLYVCGVPSGYVELYHHDDVTEIAYFGLRPQYHGRGLGKYLLSFAIAAAWETGAERVTVHTCNLDSDSALPNYIKRGFTIHHVEEEPMPTRYAV